MEWFAAAGKDKRHATIDSMAQIVWKRLEHENVTFPVAESSVVGRGQGADCDLGCKSVSRRHARIDLRKNLFYIQDMGSTNGTMVNGMRVCGPTRLSSGDVIQVGEQLLEFTLSEDEIAEVLTKGALVTEPLSGLVTAALQRRGHRRRTSQLQEVLPRRQGKFYLLERLGQGGMGVVYRAVDFDSNQQVAVKFIRRQIGGREAFLDFFHNREAVLAREINHPNIIRIYEYGLDADQHFISMEYVAGESLYETLKRQELRPAEVLEFLRQIVCGLVAAHRQGVVHSDIKPANILMVADADVALGDGRQLAPVEPEEDVAGGILEFNPETQVDTVGDGSDGQQVDDELLTEIRRRVGVSGPDVLVDPPYFERRAEFRFIDYYVRRALEGRGYFVLVEGESGNGKERLISHFLETVRANVPRVESTEPMPGFTLYELDCSRVEGLPLLYEQIFGLRPRSREGSLDLVAELAAYFVSQDKPTVVRILSLGNASALIAELICRLSKILAEKPLVLLGALNPDEIRENGALKPMLERTTAETKELYLRPLTEYQIHRYIQQIFRNAIPDPELATDLHRLSEGNFVRLLDILRGFFERGILRQDDSGRTVYRPRAQEFELEEGKNLYEKFRTLDRVEQRVLEHAAFIGPRFLFDTLSKFYALDETALFFVVRTMLSEGFFVEESRTWYGFTNVAFQRYITARIPRSERPHLHRRLSRLLQAAPVPESAELLQLRADHFYGCREHGKAVQALLEGAHLARGQYQGDLSREMFQDILRIYRELAQEDASREEMVAVLKNWFRRDGNWYEILGQLASQPNVPRVKIADFGISFRVRDQKRGYQVDGRPALGTPRYLAPERAKGDSGGPKADLFSLGVLAYEMVVGRPPFPEAKGKDVIQINHDQKIVFPDELLVGYPEGTAALLAGLVERDPERRWDAERVLRTILKLQFDLQVTSGPTRTRD